MTDEQINGILAKANIKEPPEGWENYDFEVARAVLTHLEKANEQLFGRCQKMFEDRQHWKNRALQAEASYLNMREWAEKNGLDTATYDPVGSQQVRMLTENEAKDCLVWVLLPDEVEALQRKFAEVNGLTIVNGK